MTHASTQSTESTQSAPTTPSIYYVPPVDETRTQTRAPVDQVTLLEDRAQVRRRATLQLAPGMHRLVVLDVAPTLQDVSVRAEIEGMATGTARVANIGARRAQRVAQRDRPEDIRAIDATLRDLQRDLERNEAQRRRARERHESIEQMLNLGAAEIPEDVSWGVQNAQEWTQTFTTLFARARALREEDLEGFFRAQDLVREIQALLRRRATMERPDQNISAWIELDVVVEHDPTVATAPDAPLSVPLEIFYVVPNALWRPAHRARLDEENSALHVQSEAVVWQFTGEDWDDVQLVFSTARSSLGVDPPLLRDDLLQTQRKDDSIQVAVREVEVQSASVKGGGGSAPKPSSVELPGVDDGGNIQTLKPPRLTTIPSDGRPCFVKLFTFQAEAALERVIMPEAHPNVFLKATQHNTAPHPLLAGPVELARSGGVVGATELLFVAPGERFELGFGPQDDVRVHRHAELVRDVVDPDDKWKHRRTAVTLFLSNLCGEERTVTVTERIPVSEIPQVKVQVVHESKTGKRSVDRHVTTDTPDIDEHGMVTWTVTLPPNGHTTRKLVVELSSAPNIQNF